MNATDRLNLAIEEAVSHGETTATILLTDAEAIATTNQDKLERAREALDAIVKSAIIGAAADNGGTKQVALESIDQIATDALEALARQATNQVSDDAPVCVKAEGDDRVDTRWVFPPTPNEAGQPSEGVCAVHESRVRGCAVCDGLDYEPQKPGQPSDDAVERLGEALFVLSDRLRASGVLSASDPVHQAYEGVVAAFQPLAAMQSTDTEAVIELVAALEDAVEHDTRCQWAADCPAEAIMEATQRRLKAREQLNAALAKLERRGQ
jgi:hypothetical protein